MMWFWIFPLFLLPFAVIMLVRHGAGVGCGVHHGYGVYPAAPQAPAGPDPVEIVRQRLARGEITPAEYEEIRRALG